MKKTVLFDTRKQVAQDASSHAGMSYINSEPKAGCELKDLVPFVDKTLMNLSINEICNITRFRFLLLSLNLKMVFSAIAKLYLMIFIISCHLALYSCQMTTETCPKVPNGFVDPLKFIGQNDWLTDIARQTFEWSKSTCFTEFLAFSGVLFTIAENLTVVGYILYTPFWLLEKIIGRTLSNMLFGGMLVVLVMHGITQVPADFGGVQNLLGEFYTRFIIPALTQAQITVGDIIKNFSS